MAGSKSRAAVYQIQVTLRDVKPACWRRLQVPADASLERLHMILQVAMGWQDCHLYEFQAGESSFGIPDPDFGGDTRSASRVRLQRVAPAGGARLVYRYDFGDDWVHDVVVEEILAPEQGARYPRCLGGERACPPEDCGGPWGYQELLEAIADPRHEEHASMIEWLGGSFDPEAFDPDAVNAALAGLRR